MSRRQIELRGVEVHNLRRVDLDLPHRQLIVFCGVSGSGKSSLAFDTLYAEGQRRYIETFSAYTRQFLERLEKPAAERIDGLPAAMAVAAKNPTRSNRSTVGTATETNDYLRLLFAKIGVVHCLSCGREVRRDTPQDVLRLIHQQPVGTRFLVTYPLHVEPQQLAETAAALREDGLVRAVIDQRVIELEQLIQTSTTEQDWLVVVDRLSVGSASDQRVLDSLEAAFHRGQDRCVLLFDEPSLDESLGGSLVTIDGRAWRRFARSDALRCDDCERSYSIPEPRLFSFNNPWGACPQCEGFGNVVDLAIDRFDPAASKTMPEGAIPHWNSPAYAHELEELIELAPDYKLPLDVPYAQLTERQRQLIHDGVSERKFGGLRGFFAWLERRKYKMHIRVFLSRWRSYRVCSLCHGRRLKAEALATQIGGQSIADLCEMKIDDALRFFSQLELNEHQRHVGKIMLEQVHNRLRYLQLVGLGYLTLDRSLRTLSGGEVQRVALTSALGSSLVNMLYVLDEPSVGLHPHDTDRLVSAIQSLRDRGNTVVVVEHEEAMIRAADQLVEIGPGAGERGGRVVFQGTVHEMLDAAQSMTGDYLSGRRLIATPERRRALEHGWLRLTGARGNNLRNLTVEFPLGVLCVVTGVSGSGKSTLVTDTLYPALCKRMHKEAEPGAVYDDVLGNGQIEEVILVDQSAIGRSPRSNPVTYVKAFDEIRQVFADTADARTRNYSASHFSFNVDGGRCTACEGDGYIAVDMQFLADVFMRCGQCQGRRYRREILDVTYRGRNIADVLDMTAREAFMFFRGQAKVQAKLKRLIDVGLDYLRLGQGANTLSGGEAQRLKLAAHLSASKRSRCLFILDEPTTGLHFADIVQLLDCFEALLAVGHSLIVIEHNLHLIRAADYVIDLGPGAADQGGLLVAKGTPEQVARQSESVTGRYLAESLKAALPTPTT